MAKAFDLWYTRALHRIGADRAIINATATCLKHVKVEQIIAGCHLYSALNTQEPMSIEFLKFIRGKPEIRHEDKPPCMRLTQGAKTYALYDTGIPLDEMPDYTCPTYPFRSYSRNASGFAWLYTIQDVNYLCREDAGVQLAAITRLYASVALDIANKVGLDFLVNLNMRNISPVPTELLAVDHALTSIRSVKKMSFRFSCWDPVTTVLSTADTLHVPRMRSEFFPA